MGSLLNVGPYVELRSSNGVGLIIAIYFTGTSFKTWNLSTYDVFEFVLETFYHPFYDRRKYKTFSMTFS